MNLGAALAAIAIDEAAKAARAAQNPYTAHTYAVKRWQEEQDRQDAAREAAAIAKLEAKYQARRLAKKAAEQKAATSGRGWRVLLDRSHEELEHFVHRVYDLAWHGIPWPAGWRAQWADLRGALALGMCVADQKLILIDEAAQRGRSSAQFTETIVHELCHLMHPQEVHGRGFEETLRRALAYVLGEPDAVPATAPRPPAPSGHPEPPKGVRFGRPVPWPDAGQWEYRG